MFVTNGLTLIDAPHRFDKLFRSTIHRIRQRNDVVKTDYEDKYEFQLAFNQSYVIVIFINCLLFTPLVPMFSFFACIYFYLKHKAVKYNLIFTYNKKVEQESGGRTKTIVAILMNVVMIIYMITMVGVFGYSGARQSDIYFWFGGSIGLIWFVSSLLVIKYWETE